MNATQPTPDEAAAGLAALKVVLTSDGVLNPIEARMLAASQKYILHTDIDIAQLAPITPEELAARLVRPEVRELFAGAMVIHSFASGEASPAHLEHVEAYTRAIGGEGREIEKLRRYIRRDLALLRFDVIRNMYIGDGLRKLWEDQGFKGILNALGSFKGIRTDAVLAARYQGLATLPEGTLGRAFYHHCRDNGFPFPGELYGAPEMIVIHDMVHVLGGYGVDPDGEFEVAAFSAGFRKQEQSFSILMFVLCQFDLGVHIAPVTEPTIGLLNPDRLLAALARGRQMNIDLFEGWDPWTVIDQPLEDLRKRYGIGAPHTR